MGFNDLPNEFLDMLLNTEDIPLNQRILLRSVSRRWLPVIEDGLKKKNNLFIRDVSTRISAIDSSHLELQPGGLTSELVPLLSRLFSGTKQLTLAFGGFSDPVPSPNWRGVPSLLTQLGANLNSNLTPNLTSVKLCGCITETVIAPLANALTGLSHLSALSLDRGQSGVLLLPRIEGVLSHLEAFAFADLNAPTASLSSLKQLPTSLKHLHLMKCYSTGSVWPIIRHIGGLTTLNLGFGSCVRLSLIFIHFL